MTFLLQYPVVLLICFALFGFAKVVLFDVSKEDCWSGGTPRKLTGFFTYALLFFSLILCLAFNQAAGFQFLYCFDIALVSQYNLTLTFGADGISMIFLLLTLFVFPVCFLATFKQYDAFRTFFSFLMGMELLLILTFTTLDLFYFYVFFEGLLIPMFVMIGMWGSRRRKIKAAYYFFLYTLFGSLIMLFGVLYLYLITGSTNYFVILYTVLDPEQQHLIWLCFFVAFAVKMPLFPLHIWLPEAHVEAPTIGSMLLASLLLKLGGYGFLRFSITMVNEGSMQYSPVVFTLALLGVIYGSLSTIRQIDLKRIIAYSSVAHMNLVVLGLFSNNQQGLDGAIYLMVAHGVVSTALFYAIGILYQQYHSRLLRYYGGIVERMPLFAAMLFLFTLANMSFPGTSNFLGELLLFIGVFANNNVVLLFSTLGIVLSAVYSVWLFNRVAFGTLKRRHIEKFKDMDYLDDSIFFALLPPMLALGLSATFLTDYLALASGLIVVAVITVAERAFIRVSEGFANIVQNLKNIWQVHRPPFVEFHDAFKTYAVRTYRYMQRGTLFMLSVTMLVCSLLPSMFVYCTLPPESPNFIIEAFSSKPQAVGVLTFRVLSCLPIIILLALFLPLDKRWVLCGLVTLCAVGVIFLFSELLELFASTEQRTIFSSHNFKAYRNWKPAELQQFATEFLNSRGMRLSPDAVQACIKNTESPEQLKSYLTIVQEVERERSRSAIQLQQLKEQSTISRKLRLPEIANLISIAFQVGTDSVKILCTNYPVIPFIVCMAGVGILGSSLFDFLAKP